jgi:hypothetical protein
MHKITKNSLINPCERPDEHSREALFAEAAKTWYVVLLPADMMPLLLSISRPMTYLWTQPGDLYGVEIFP